MNTPLLSEQPITPGVSAGFGPEEIVSGLAPAAIDSTLADASLPTSRDERQAISLCGIQIDAVTMSQAVTTIFQWIAVPRGCRYVVTPNVDHVVVYQEHAALRNAYAGASLVLADGFPVAVAARLLGKPLPGRVPGSDLVPALLAAARLDRPLRVYLLGAGPGVAERAATKIHHRWPAVTVAGTYSPPLGFERDEAENERILARIAEARVDLLVIGLGAPKQELWVSAWRDRIQAAAAVCAGATIDFLAGEKRRAPVWMRVTGLEWFHRLCSEPRRLARRYARDAWIFPRLIYGEWLQGRGARRSEA